jgi:small subunit ribosomal protein S6e
MKINIANPSTGCQKIFDIEDDKKLRCVYEKRIAQEFDASPLDDKLKGYILRITGGNDKQGFPMKQGVLTNLRVRLLLDGQSGCFRRPTHDGERKRRTVRGCIVGADLAVVNTIIVKKGPQEIEGLTDKVIPRRLGPKRASKIRKLFNLTKDDDVRKYVVRRTVQVKKGKYPTKSKAPRIQRLVTSLTLQRKRARMSEKKRLFARARAEAADYAKVLRERALERRKKRQEMVAKRRAANKKSAPTALHKATLKAMKKIVERVSYVEKRRAETRAASRRLTKAQRKEGIRKRKDINQKRKATLKKIIEMHAAAKRTLAVAKKQVATFPTRAAVRHLQKTRARAHDLYLRIMSGGRLPNLEKRRRIAKRRKQRRHTRAVRAHIDQIRHIKHEAHTRRVAKLFAARRAARKAAAKKAGTYKPPKKTSIAKTPAKKASIAKTPAKKAKI